MKKTIFITAIIMVLIFSLSVAAYARGGRGGQGFGPGQKGMGGPMMRFWENDQAVEKLGLTDEQIQTLSALDDDFREEQIDLKADVQKAHLQLKQAFGNAGTSERDIRAIAQTVSDLQEKMFMTHIENRIKIRQVLTAEQKEKLDSVCPMGGPGNRGQGGMGRGMNRNNNR